ncbi:MULTISPECIES: DivIVA domain-containing protein [unclassified Nonomuraea]|uniref:DivIVA domain-containing protein n=1 Tax=unclassified Nonomuraea TaxID=2593643 RepID=UPI0035BF1A7F
MARFRVRFRGYRRDQVDELAERVQRALGGSGELSGAELRKELTEGGLELVLRGYDPREVHAALDEWVRRLDGR